MAYVNSGFIPIDNENEDHFGVPVTAAVKSSTALDFEFDDLFASSPKPNCPLSQHDDKFEDPQDCHRESSAVAVDNDAQDEECIAGYNNTLDPKSSKKSMNDFQLLKLVGKGGYGKV
jgi:hypothetical protein